MRREDKITIEGVKIQPRIGVTPGERRLPQSCSADIILWGDFESAASTDSLSNAVDYGRVLQQVLEISHEREYNLVETLAYRIARQVLQEFAVNRVRVRLRKRPTMLSDKLDFIEVEVEVP